MPPAYWFFTDSFFITTSALIAMIGCSLESVFYKCSQRRKMSDLVFYKWVEDDDSHDPGMIKVAPLHDDSSDI